MAKIRAEDAVDILLEGNEALNATLAEFMSPLITRSTFTNADGIGKLLLSRNSDTS